MIEFVYTVTDPEGIHARPAAELIKKASGFQSAITLYAGDKKANAKAIFGVMGLCAKKGTQLRVAIEGKDEDAAAAALEAFMKEML